MDERCRPLGFWSMMAPFQAVTPSSGFSPLVVSSLKIGNLPSALPGFDGIGGIYPTVTPSLTPPFRSTNTNNSSTNASNSSSNGTNPLSPLSGSPLSSPLSPLGGGSGLDRVLPTGARGSLGSLAVGAGQLPPVVSQGSPAGALSTGALARSVNHSSLVDPSEAKLIPFRPFSASPYGSPTPPPSTITTTTTSSSSSSHHHGGNLSPLPAGKKPAKVCGVCGDRAKSYHFGGISCDSCKAFFRRSVQNEAYKNFQCPYEAKCDITIASRKCCQFCRFRKCNEIGMEKGWVMTEVERSQLLKSRLERKQRLLAAKTTGASSSSSSPSHAVGNISSEPASSSTADAGGCARLASSTLASVSSSTNPTSSNASSTEIAEGLAVAVANSPSTIVPPSDYGPHDSAIASRATAPPAQASPRSSSRLPSTLVGASPVAVLPPTSDLTSEDIALIEELINCHLRCCPVPRVEGLAAGGGGAAECPPAADDGSPHEPLPTRHLLTRSYVLQLFVSAIRQFSCFAQQLASSQVTPIAALRISVLEMLFLRSAFAYDARLKGWVASHKASLTDEALVYFEDVRELVDDERLLEKHKRFMKSMQASMPEKDLVVYTILMAICFHCGDRKDLLDSGHIVEEQDRYINLLQRYLRFRYKATKGNAVFARILLKLADLREVAELHQEFDLKPTEEETREIQEHLAQQALSASSGSSSSGSPSKWRFHEHVSSWIAPSLQQGTAAREQKPHRNQEREEASTTGRDA